MVVALTVCLTRPFFKTSGFFLVEDCHGIFGHFVMNSEAYCNFVMISMKVLILLSKNRCGLNYLSDMPIFQKFVTFPMNQA